MATPLSVLYAAESDITIERIRALVRQVGPESPTVEYKEKPSETIAKGVAAMANTYGGLMLVGVTDTDRQVRGVKEKAIEAIAEHCAANIEPPYVPEIISVPLGQGSDLYVLVLRVVPGSHPRPLLVGGMAPVRHQNTTHPADWQRLRDLFTTPGGAHPAGPWSIQSPDLPLQPQGGYDETVDFMLRSGVAFPVSREAKERPIPERAVNELAASLNTSPLSAILMHLSMAGARNGGANPFSRSGHNRARTVRMQWTGYPDWWEADLPPRIEAIAQLNVPGGYGRSDREPLFFTLDVLVRDSAAIKIIQRRDGADTNVEPARVSPKDLAQVIDALVATLSSAPVAAALAAVAGIDETAVPQPRVLHLKTSRPTTDVLYMDGLRQIDGAGNSMGGSVLATPARDLREAGERHAQVKEWLLEIALDSGLLGMERIGKQIDLG